MTTSWSGVYVEADRKALSALPARAYMVLRYLCTRADHLGRCYPGIARIAEDLGEWGTDTVAKHLALLEQYGYICYLRKNERDAITGRQLPNVFMINPSYLFVAPESYSEAVSLWLYAKADPNSDPNFGSGFEPNLGTNQQQNHLQESTTENQLQETTTTTTAASEGESDFGIGKTAQKNKKSAAVPAIPSPKPKTTGEAHSAPSAKKTSVPRDYEQLQPVRESLTEPDERLAVLIRDELCMPLPIARALIIRHGGGTVQTAMNTDFVKQAASPGGALRYILAVAWHQTELPTVTSAENRLNRFIRSQPEHGSPYEIEGGD